MGFWFEVFCPLSYHLCLPPIIKLCSNVNDAVINFSFHFIHSHVWRSFSVASCPSSCTPSASIRAKVFRYTQICRIVCVFVYSIFRLSLFCFFFWVVGWLCGVVVYENKSACTYMYTHVLHYVQHIIRNNRIYCSHIARGSRE